MFTGIITDIGTIMSLERHGGVTASIVTSYDLDTIELGASIACSGVCLTVTKKMENSFSVDVSEETLSRTNITYWQKGTKINLERALKLGDEFGGHIVSGHVDGLAVIEDIRSSGISKVFTFSVPNNLAKYIAEKGSVTLNGVSLTVNAVNGNQFSVNIIPHSFEKTTFSDLSKGDKVNIEIDMLARYISRMLEFRD